MSYEAALRKSYTEIRERLTGPRPKPRLIASYPIACAETLPLPPLPPEQPAEVRPARKPFPGSVAEIIAITADHFEVLRSDVVAGGKEPWKLFPRQVAMYLAHHKAGRSLPEIGRAFDFDHTTVLNNARKIARRLEAGDECLQAIVDEVWRRIELHDISATERIPRPPRKRSTSYSEADTKALIRMWTVERRSAWEIAKALRRTPKGIAGKIKDLKLHRTRVKPA